MKIFFILLLFANFILYSEENFEKYTIGYSVNKKPIDLYKFGNGKQVLLIIAGIHGNEENTTKTAYYLINNLDEKKIHVNDDKSIWIIPVLNPDGIARGRRLNDNDVDLNRNFDTDNWKPTFIFYNNLLSAGREPFSEPETTCIKELFEKVKNEYMFVVLSLHSSGNAIIPGDNSKFNKQLSSILYENSNYVFSDIGYNTTGDLTAWLSSKLKIASLTIEFKTKNETDNDEMVNITTSLQNINFDKNIYNTGINIIDFFTKNESKQINSLTKGLPKNISDNIKASNPNIFLENYNSSKEHDDLLLLVNKTNHLSPNYVPLDLITLSSKEYSSNKINFQLRKIILPDLKNMFNDAKKDGILLSIISAYRSYNSQKIVYDDWKLKLGEKEASRVSAKAGASQHQLGTTIDFNSLNDSFENTKEEKWLLDNAYKYGFVLSYPKDQENITGYKFEPWHYRYIGKESAFLVYNFFDNSLEIFLNWFWEKNDEK